MPVLSAPEAIDCLSRRRVDALVLLSPTYGDSELEPGFEVMLKTLDWSRLAGVPYAFCEVGIYTGYEDFGHGLAPQVTRVLGAAGLVEAAPTLSLDAVPITDWPLLDRWADLVRERLAALA